MSDTKSIGKIAPMIPPSSEGYSRFSGEEGCGTTYRAYHILVRHLSSEFGIWSTNRSILLGILENLRQRGKSDGSGVSAENLFPFEEVTYYLCYARPDIHLCSLFHSREDANRYREHLIRLGIGSRQVMVRPSFHFESKKGEQLLNVCLGS